jgi:hypothetical protein
MPCSYHTRVMVKEAKLSKDMTHQEKKKWLLRNINEQVLKKAKKSIERIESYPD